MGNDNNNSFIPSVHNSYSNPNYNLINSHQPIEPNNL